MANLCGSHALLGKLSKATIFTVLLPEKPATKWLPWPWPGFSRVYLALKLVPVVGGILPPPLLGPGKEANRFVFGNGDAPSPID
jgi:hypothetical protein